MATSKDGFKKASLEFLAIFLGVGTPWILLVTG